MSSTTDASLKRITWDSIASVSHRCCRRCTYEQLSSSGSAFYMSSMSTTDNNVFLNRKGKRKLCSEELAGLKSKRSFRIYQNGQWDADHNRKGTFQLGKLLKPHLIVQPVDEMLSLTWKRILKLKLQASSQVVVGSFVTYEVPHSYISHLSWQRLDS